MFARKYLIFLLVVMIPTFNACKPKEQKPPVAPIPRGIPVKKERPQLVDVDKSPMDMSYYPPEYPILKMTGKVVAPPIARVIYSRPFTDGRVIFGNLIKYGEHWRLGANEATEIEFFTDVSILDKKVKKGRYILYCIPFEDKWTLVLNNDLYVWGLKIHSSADVTSFNVPT
ncbi:MAG: DUF2911 domain-containing protein, partial [Flavitalea sp.]